MVWLREVHRVVRELTDVVRPTFGPQGLDQLFLSTNHSILITSSASTILHSFTPSHPIASLICHQLRSTSLLVGDGSATLLLLLEAAVNEAVRAVEERGVSLHGADNESSHTQRAKYAQAMHWLLAGLATVEQQWLRPQTEDEVEESGLIQTMRRVGRDVTNDLPSMLGACRQLLQTQLGQSSFNLSSSLWCCSRWQEADLLSCSCLCASGAVQCQRIPVAGAPNERLPCQERRLLPPHPAGKLSSPPPAWHLPTLPLTALPPRV